MGLISWVRTLLESGIAGALCVIVYALVVHVIVPLMQKGKGDKGTDGVHELQRNHTKLRGRFDTLDETQRLVNSQVERRITGLETEVGGVRTTLAGITRTVDLSESVLKRVDDTLTELMKRSNE